MNVIPNFRDAVSNDSLQEEASPELVAALKEKKRANEEVLLYFRFGSNLKGCIQVESAKAKLQEEERGFAEITNKLLKKKKQKKINAAKQVYSMAWRCKFFSF